MSEEIKNPQNSDFKTNEELGVTQEVIDFVSDLLHKAKVTNEKTKPHANSFLWVGLGDVSSTNIRVDDYQLLYVGAALLPNMVNYLVNILPQFLYPYVVAYLQQLSELREDPFTITELFDIIQSIQFSEK